MEFSRVEGKTSRQRINIFVSRFGIFRSNLVMAGVPDNTIQGRDWVEPYFRRHTSCKI